jgi:hypothetical protein
MKILSWKGYHMYLYRAPGTPRRVVIALPEFKSFLLEQGFDPQFVQRLGIFLLPTDDDDGEEDALMERSPVDLHLFLFCDGRTSAQLNWGLLRLTRRIAFEMAELPLGASTFPGSQELFGEAREEDIDLFGALSELHHFISLSPDEQREEESDDPVLRMKAARAKVEPQGVGPLENVKLGSVGDKAYPQSPQARSGETEEQRIQRLLQEGTREQCTQEALYWLNYYMEVGEELEPVSTAQELLGRVLSLSNMSLPPCLDDVVS